jgi:hypothetical protein
MRLPDDGAWIMLGRNALLVGLAALAIVAGASLATKARLRSVGGGSVPTISSVTYGSQFKYSSLYPTHYMQADLYMPTWADDDGLYGFADDTITGPDGTLPDGRPVEAVKLSSCDSSVIITNVNSLDAWWGSAGAVSNDGGNFKAAGTISVGGVLYANFLRNFSGSASGGQIVKSLNHGGTWTPAPPPVGGACTAGPCPYATPMWPTTRWLGGWFQYGKNYAGTSDALDNSGTYVYAMVPDGTETFSTVWLGRVKIVNIGNQNAADWSFWIGGDGMDDANWISDITSVRLVPIINSSGQAGFGYGAQYLPAFGQYLYVASQIGPPTSTKVWYPWVAPHPWGPWTLLSGSETTWYPQGFYHPYVCPKSVAADGGRHISMTTAADYTQTSANGGQYTLWIISTTLQ